MKLFKFVTLVLRLVTPPVASDNPGAQPNYPPDFLWGAAMAAHQAEGISGGGQLADWYAFEHTSDKIRDRATADLATDHWHRFREDYDLAKTIGLNSIRTSVSWEKIEPAKGEFNKEVIQHYRTEFEYMRKLGLRPMITLLHGAVPVWFNQRGGWLAADSPLLFADYAQFVVRNLGDLCDLWVTVNEPVVLIGDGYLEGIIPPRVSSPQAALTAAWNLARAHRLATSRIHELQPPLSPSDPRRLRGVGLVNGLDLFRPCNRLNPLETIVNTIVVELSNWAFPTAAIYGRFETGDFIAALLRGGPRRPAEAIDYPNEHGSPVLDWIGINYYTLSLVHFNIFKGAVDFLPPPGPKTDIGRDVYPKGTEKILRETAAHFPGFPLVITENGVSDARDAVRPQFIHDTLHYLDRARFGHGRLPPIDVRGYYHWSLTDDFEWQYGYFSRYGLIAIDYDHDLQRVRRKSADVYRSEIEARRTSLQHSN